MTTYIKRVPQFKAVQYRIDSNTRNTVLDLVPNVTEWKIDDTGFHINFLCKKLSVLRSIRMMDGDYIVKDEESNITHISERDFKAQYEAAPEEKAVDFNKLRDDALSANRSALSKRWRELARAPEGISWDIGFRRGA